MCWSIVRLCPSHRRAAFSPRPSGFRTPSRLLTISAVVAFSQQCVSFPQFLRDAVASLPPAGVFRNFHFPADAQHFSSLNRSQGLSSYFLFPLTVSRPSPVRSSRQVQAGGVHNAFYSKCFFICPPARFLPAAPLPSPDGFAAGNFQSVVAPSDSAFLFPATGRTHSRPVRVPPSLFRRASAALNIR